jgi:hypothetical protein
MTTDGEPSDVVSSGAALPDDEMLAAGLGAAAILERGELPAMCSADCQIVACRMPDGSQRQLFCKFGPLAEVQQPTHRFGVAYEAQVYDQLLPAWPGDVPPLHGALLDETTHTVGLALGYLDGATPLHQVLQPKTGLMAAAEWIARFHRWSEAAAVPSFLHRYDTDFYRLWVDRAGRFSHGLHERFPWMADFCEHCRRRLPALLPPATIIHGEYQANNILVRDGCNVVADWESAALAASEIDLASLTWGWDDDLVALCEQQYCLARWPEGTPGDFDLRLTAARIYLHLRWLGDADEEDGLEAQICDLEELLLLAQRLKGLER